MSRFTPFASYESEWEYVYGENGVALEADAWFAERFHDGHRTSIRSLASSIHEIVHERGFEAKASPGTECSFHIRALKLLIDYGIDYEPDLSKTTTFRTHEEQPVMGHCFTNSWLLMEAVNSNISDTVRLSYVEGMVWGYRINPVLHAWNSYGLRDTRAVDWTHYVACQWNRYLGIPFTEEERTELQALVYPDEPRRPVSLFDGKFYPRIEERILEILANRNQPTLGN